MHQMVNLDTSGRAAARNSAASAVATPDEPYDARRHILVSALGNRTVDRSDVLGIAACALERGCADGELRTGALLPALTAALAHDHGDLVLRSTGRLGHRCTIEHGGSKRRDQLIVGEMAAMLIVE